MPYIRFIGRITQPALRRVNAGILVGCGGLVKASRPHKLFVARVAMRLLLCGHCNATREGERAMSDPLRVLEVLRQARARIEDPRNWWTPERGMRGECIFGAQCALTTLQDGAGEGLTPVTYAAAQVLADVMGVEWAHRIPRWNDSHTHAEVLAAFDTAIAGVEGEWADSIMATPNADALARIMAACDGAGEVVARHIASEHPEMDLDEVTALVSGELFYAAQDTARACSLGIAVERP